MSVAQTQLMSWKREKASARKIVRLLGLALIWGAIFCWCWLALQGPALQQIWVTIQDLAKALGIYWAALGTWILARVVIYRFRRPATLEAFEEPAFEQDYFGRTVAVAEGASFSDQHLVLEYTDGRKLYRAPEQPKDKEAGKEEIWTTASGDLVRLAAAAGAGGSTAPRPSPAPDERPHVRNL